MTYTVYAHTRTGWQKMRSFDNPAEADEWLTAFIKCHRYACTDFTIKYEKKTRRAGK